MRSMKRILITIGLTLPFAAQPAGAQQPLTRYEQDLAGRQAQTIAAIETLIAQADAARLEGDCRAFRRLLDQARSDLDNTSYQMVPVDTHSQLTREISELRGRPCLRQLRANEPSRATPTGDMPMPNLLRLQGGLGTIRLPRTNYGFRRDGAAGSADEKPAGRSARGLSTYWFGGSLTLPDFGEIFASYTRGSDRTNFAVPVLGNGGASGIVNTNEAPSGSTGVTADFGVTGDTRTRLQGVELGYRRYFRIGEARTVEPRVRAYVGLSGYYERLNHDASLLMSGTTGGGFNFNVTQNLDQRVETLRIGPQIGLDFRVPITPELIFGATAQAGVHYYDFDLRSLEQRTQNIGPTADQNFENRIEDGRSGVGLDASLRAIVELRLSNQAAFAIMAMAMQMSHRPQVVNPASGDQLLAGTTTHLQSRSATELRFGGMLRIQFR